MTPPRLKTTRNCTWVGCALAAAHEHTDTKGRAWAYLCCDHHEEFDLCMRAAATHPERLIGLWVKAQGGARKTADTFAPEVEIAARMLMRLMVGPVVLPPVAVPDDDE